jgi:hypothetical protein
MEKTMSKATPRPWIIRVDENFLGSAFTEKVYSIYDQKVESFICDAGSVKNETTLANAELIVKAVNMHDEMVEFLQMVDKEYASHNFTEKEKEKLKSILEKTKATL